jgi:uncharacterized damage-inducible protein DinB
MIGPDYVEIMARYNAEANRRLYAAAARLSQDERTQDRGAFWGSIHRTFNHLLWGDRVWISRFDGLESPEVIVPERGAELFDNFSEQRRAREDLDARICRFCDIVTDGWLAGRQRWFNPETREDRAVERGFLVMHFFNHQTHHRGQAHAMITAAGEQTGDMDIILLVAPPGL